MGEKRLYPTVDEKEELKALIKKYGLEERSTGYRSEIKPQPRIARKLSKPSTKHVRKS